MNFNSLTQIGDIEFFDGEAVMYLVSKNPDFADLGYYEAMFFPALHQPAENMLKGKPIGDWDIIEYHSESWGKESLEEDIEEELYNADTALLY
jgi:hypothetical protein